MAASNPCKFIFVSGGVLSSLGKGVAAATIGALMESRGLKVTLIKFDPYINIDPGLMSPSQHGEIFVTDDGAECDLDLGHYERYTHAQLGRDNNVTAGRIYNSVIQRERAGDYGGGTVQVIPHVTDEIKNHIKTAARDHDITIIEIGGTVGDIESLPFLEAARQFRLEVGSRNVLFVHLTLVPFIKTSGEVKTKPSQHSVATLRGIGIQPDILICRSETGLDQNLKSKLSLFCNVEQDAVISAADVAEVYELPLNFHQEGLDNQIVRKLDMWTRQPDLKDWEELVGKLKNPRGLLRVGLLDEGPGFKESYKSLLEALIHSGARERVKIEAVFIDVSQSLAEADLAGFDAFLAPNCAVIDHLNCRLAVMKAVRQSGKPVLALGTGFQIMLIEAARNLAGLPQANSREFTPTASEPIFQLLPHWFNPRINQRETRPEGEEWGILRRKGAYPCRLAPGSRLAEIYQKDQVWERHRLRGEFNPAYRSALEAVGFNFSAVFPDDSLIEAAELTEHPFYIGCRFQPEFLSRPLAPHPLITAFIAAAVQVLGPDRLLNGGDNDNQTEC